MGQRVSWIDSAKLIGMFMVVLGHLKIPSYISAFIYSFHMPLFFLLSGLTFGGGDNFFVFVKKKVRTLLVPYFSFAVLTYLYWVIVGRHFGVRGDGSTDILRPLVGILYSNGVDGWLEFNTPLWFLTCLFVVEMCFYSFFRRPLPVLALMIFISGAIGYYLSLVEFVRLPWGANVALTGIVFYGVGYLSRGLIARYQIGGLHNLILAVISSVACFIVSDSNGRVDMNANFYGSIGLFYLAAFLGVFAVVNFSLLMPVNCVSEFFGRNALVVLALHGVFCSVVKGVMVFVFMVDRAEFVGVFYNLLVVFCSFFVAVPVIMFINRFMPSLVGRPAS